MSNAWMCVFSLMGIALMTLPLAEGQFSLSSLLGSSTSSLLNSQFGGLGGLLTGSTSTDSFITSYLQRIPGYPRQCYNGQIYMICGCTKRCSDINQPFGCRNCRPGCSCRPGLFRGQSGTCLGALACAQENARNSLFNPRPVIQRPQLTTTQTSQSGQGLATNPYVVTPATSSGCFGGRIRTRCARCDIFCGQETRPPPCPYRCRVGCACPRGYFVNEANQCVLSSQCFAPGGNSAVTVTTTRATTTTAFTVPPTEIVTDRNGFGPRGECPGDLTSTNCLCNRTCENRLLNVRCDTDVCVPGCGCPGGYLISGTRCVFLNDCPNEASLNTGVEVIEETNFGVGENGNTQPIVTNPSSPQCSFPCLYGGRCAVSRVTGIPSCICPFSRSGADCSVNRAANRCYPLCRAPQECRLTGLFGFRCV